MDEYLERFEKFFAAGRINRSSASFKIRLFLQKGENSLLIAKHLKELVPSEGEPKRMFWDHWAITVSYLATRGSSSGRFR